VRQPSSRMARRRHAILCTGVGLGLVLALVETRPARGCDVCAIYTATEQRESQTGLRVGIAEQYTSYDTEQLNGTKVGNPAGEYLNSYITQLLVAYNFTPRLGAQLNVPVISRVYRRQEENGVVDGDESGIGDLSLLANGVLFSDVTDTSVMRWSAFGGLKLPSGNSHRLKEELMEHGDVQSGVHGHDLALGSGSTDVVLGSQAFGSWNRLFASGTVGYVIRTSGSFGYHYANDLTWNTGPGVFALLEHDYSLGIQAALSGESKGKDTLNGVTADDTARTGAYIGPSVNFTWGASLAAEAAVDIPFVQNNSAFQIVPDYRLRFGGTWTF